MITALGIFVFVLTVIVSVYWLFVLRPEYAEEGALRTRLRPAAPRLSSAAVVNAPEQLSAVKTLHAALARWGHTLEPLRALLSRAGSRMTVATLLMASIFIGLCVLLGVTLATSRLLAGTAAGVAAACLPIAYVRRAARKRLEKFEEEFPEAVDLLARSLRAGHALTTALQMAGEEIAEPVGGEFRRLFDQQNYGMSVPDALRAFAGRVPLLDARFFVTAVLTQRETGGNLSEVLDNLSAVIRERFKVKRQVRALSAHGRITGLSLVVLPIAVAAGLTIIAPQHVRVLINDPLGIKLTLTAVVLQIIGFLAIRRIVNVEY